MKKILIPTDFSETAMNAIKYAMELFKYDKSEFLILHAFADEVYNNSIEMSRDYFEEYKDKVQINVDKDLKKILAEMLEISPNPRHAYKSISTFGSLVDDVNTLVDKENIDVVVMGTKGKTNNKDITFGSNTLKVIKYVKCPVLAVPVSYHENHPKTILFPTDYMIPFKKRELKLLGDIAMNYISSIYFLYVSKLKTLSHRQIDNQSFLEGCLVNNKFMFSKNYSNDIVETINSTISSDNIDLLVMVNHRQSYLENLFHDAKIEKINLTIPFLVLQNLQRNAF